MRQKNYAFRNEHLFLRVQVGLDHHLVQEHQRALYHHQDLQAQALPLVLAHLGFLGDLEDHYYQYRLQRRRIQNGCYYCKSVIYSYDVVSVWVCELVYL